jgi:hypothetical protein
VSTADRAAIERVGEFLLEFYRPHLAIDPEFGFTFRLFGEFADYQRFRAVHAPTVRSREGFYSGRLGSIVLHLGSHFPATAFHEMNHAVLSGHVRGVPPWLGEGLSEYFEGAVAEERIRVRPQLQKRRRLMEWLAEGRELKLPTLLALTRAEWPARNEAAGRAYSTLAWGIVWHLMQEPSGRRTLESVLRQVAAGRDGAQGLAESYPGGLAGLEHDLGRTFAPGR